MKESQDDRLNPVSKKLDYELLYYQSLSQIKKSEARLAETQSLAKVGSWETDLFTLEVLWSEEIYRIFEIDPGTFPISHLSFLEFVHPHDRAAVNDAFVNSFNTRLSNIIEHRIITPKNTTKFVEERWKVFTDGSGRPARAVGTCQDITERKKAEDLIKFKAELLNTIGQAVLATNLDGTVTYWNKAAEQTYGWTAQEALGQNVMDLIPANQSKEQAKEIMKQLSCGQEWSREFTVKHKNGDTFPVYVTDAPIYDQYNKISGIIGVSSDITKRKSIEAKIAQSEQHYRTLFEQNLVGFYQSTIEGVILDCNEAFARMLKYDSCKEMLEKNATELYFTSADRINFINNIRSQKKIHNLETVLKGKDESLLFFLENISLRKDPLTGQERCDGIIIDITDKKLAEENLREKHEQLLASQSMAHIGSWHKNITDIKEAELKPIIFSDEALKILGLPQNYQSFIFKNFLELVHPKDIQKVNKASQTIFDQSASYYRIEHRIILPDQTIKWVLRDAKVITDKMTGQPFKIIGTIQDITLLKEQELRLQKINEERETLVAELTRSITELRQFTFITSHNFKAPLSNLLALLTLIDYTTLTDENREIVKMFNAATNQLQNTINDLINTLIIKNNVNVDLHLNDIDEVIDEVSGFAGVELRELDCPIKKNLEVKKIFFNKLYFQSILFNLISNAIKYRSPERSLQVDVSTRQLSDREVLMIVKDNGTGIDLNRHKDRIFGLYQRFHSNADGAGLGLFIVKSQVTALGGRIEVESEIGKGTSFYIYFNQKNMT